MVRRIGESRAWLLVARQARIHGSGLCFQIENWRWRISPEAVDSMMKKIRALVRSRGHRNVSLYLYNNYLWPLTKEGYEARTKWARKQSLASRKARKEK